MDTGVFNTSEDFVVRTYADMVYKIAVRYTANLTDADDVFSETFLAYFRKERQFNSEEHRKAWLIRVAINCAKDQLRGRQQSCELEADPGSVEQGFTKAEELADLRSALKRLRPEYREVICLFYLQDLSVKMIAEVLGRNESTVKTQLSRAREQLKVFLEEPV